MNFTEQDFTLDRIIEDGGDEDYWFKVNEEASKKLAFLYGKTYVSRINEVVYRKDEDIVWIKRQFMPAYDVFMSYNGHLKSITSNCDVVMAYDEQLKNVLKNIIKQDRKNKILNVDFKRRIKH